MRERFRHPQRTWYQKFRCAFRGLWLGVRGQTSFLVHFVAAGLALLAGAVLGVERIEWCVLLLCITIVLASEMFNSALEHLARAVDRSENRHLGSALDIGSAAVLLAAMGASLVGSLVLVVRVTAWIGVG
ncbi:MAG: diacylglycerol kinase family protein [Candidatus Anammoximicrobium sp.]|nr:diacylglycerol kinase family protein [Candidatus Anammoximicrobium sp.]